VSPLAAASGPGAPPFAGRRFIKAGWVVPDVHAAMAAWTQTAGVGPFFHFASIPFEAPRYRGAPAEPLDITAAIAQAGDLQIEVLAQHCERPSIFRDVVPAGKTGFHHMTLACDDYDADLAAFGADAEIAFEARMMGGRVCWLDTRPGLGFMLELIEASPAAEAVFGAIRAAAETWDGQDPVRSLG
jgi:hypothetical protein